MQCNLFLNSFRKELVIEEQLLGIVFIFCSYCRGRKFGWKQGRIRGCRRYLGERLLLRVGGDPGSRVGGSSGGGQ